MNTVPFSVGRQRVGWFSLDWSYCGIGDIVKVIVDTGFYRGQVRGGGVNWISEILYLRQVNFSTSDWRFFDRRMEIKLLDFWLEGIQISNWKCYLAYQFVRITVPYSHAIWTVTIFEVNKVCQITFCLEIVRCKYSIIESPLDLSETAKLLSLGSIDEVNSFGTLSDGELD